jgi:hypothetical protein
MGHAPRLRAVGIAPAGYHIRPNRPIVPLTLSHAGRTQEETSQWHSPSIRKSIKV